MLIAAGGRAIDVWRCLEKEESCMKRFISIVLLIMLVFTVSLSGCAKREKSDSSNAATKTEDTSTASDDLHYEAKSKAPTNIGNQANQTDGRAYDIVGETKADNSIAGYETEDYKSSIYKYSFQENSIIGKRHDSEEYTQFDEIGFKDTRSNPLSTFSIDVDTASYTKLRKDLNYGILPDPEAVRIEEMLNYFTYNYKEPVGSEVFTINTEIGKCPWQEGNYLLTVGILGKNVAVEQLPKSNLVFLIDVSGSMDESDKLPLLKNAFSKLVKMLGENDRVSIVAYAGNAGIVLDSVPGNKKEIILRAIDKLEAGGSTGGAGGIDLAYRLAEENFIKGGNNRIILATDGDFNVGPSSTEELERIIEKKRESGIFLSVMGFGTGNLKDNRMEVLADKGNGNYSYVDSAKEAKKVLVDEMAGTLLTIAKDVKIQLEFNPASVASYRLIGYENRALANEDFENDKIDAGELGAGHRVTAVYEIVPANSSSANKALKYQKTTAETASNYKDEIAEVRLRYKEPDGTESKEIKQVVTYNNTPVNRKEQSEDFYFAAAVAQFGLILRDSAYKGEASLNSVMDLAEKGLGEDEEGYRLEFLELVERYKDIRNYIW